MRAILTYHSIDGSGSPVSVSESAFRDHVRWLESGSVRVVPLADITSVPPDQDAVAVTFDDALESFGRIAAPLLADAGLPVTVFVPADFAGRTGSWAGTGGAIPALPVLSWDELRKLSERGVSLGAHTRTHPVLTTLGPSELAEEIGGSADRIQEETGVRPVCFAYPYGLHDQRVVAEAARAFELAVTADLGWLGPRPDPHRLPRLDMWYFRDPRNLLSWGTVPFIARLGARRVARRVKRALVGGGP